VPLNPPSSIHENISPPFFSSQRSHWARPRRRNRSVIRRIRDNHQYIAHYHTAGNPGRAKIDDTQEINYPPIMREILKTGYTGLRRPRVYPLLGRTHY